MENLKEGREEVSYSKALGCKLFYTIFNHAKYVGKKITKTKKRGGGGGNVSKRYFMLKVETSVTLKS